MRTALGLIRRPAVTAVCVLFVCLASSARGEDALTIDRVEVGIGGAYKVGLWTGVTVEITAPAAGQVQLMVEAPDPDGNWVATPPVDHELPKPGTHRLRGVFRLGQLRSALRVEVRDARGNVARWSSQGISEEGSSLAKPYRQTAFLIATLGHPGGWRQLHDESEAAFTESGSKKISEIGFRLVELESFDDLPTDVAAFQSLDLLVISGKYDIDPARSEVLRQWVRAGGHLIVSVGRNVAGFQASPLLSWIPVSAISQETIREVGGLEGFAGRGVRLLQIGATIPAAKLEVKEGFVLASGIDVPFVICSPVGAGRVTTVAVDLETPPLSTWSSVDALGRRLTGHVTQAIQNRSRESSGQLATSGVTDMASQLYRTLDGFSEVSRSSTWTVMGLLLVYLAVIGPVDYFLVHRLLRRPQLTWVTLPLFVGLSVWLTVWGGRTTNGTEVRANQLDIVDIDAASNTATLSTLATVYSPQSRRYPVDLLPPDTVASTAEASQFPFQPISSLRGTWHGVPEDRFGGLYREGGIEIGRISYSLNTAGTGLENVPIPVWSAKSVDAEWQAEVPSPVESDLSSRGAGRLYGSLRHHFRGELKDWILAHGRQVYRPVATTRNPEAKLAPDQIWEVADASPRELSGYLTGTVQQYVESDVTNVISLVREQVPYDKTSRDPGYILKMMTFYREAGGLGYTGLENNALRSFDFSPLLDLNRAVLYGRLDGPTAEVTVDGKPVKQGRNSTYVRVILPVKDLRVPEELPKVNTEGEETSEAETPGTNAGDATASK